jgi:hypothetical protein
VVAGPITTPITTPITAQGEIRMMPAALIHVLFDESRRDALNRVRARRAIRSEQTSPRRMSTRSAGARVTS